MTTTAAQGRLLALDPGLRDAGLAVFAAGELAAAWWLRAEAPLLAPCAVCQRRRSPCPHAADPAQLGAMLDEARRLAGPLDGFGLVVTEWPYVPGPARRLDPAPLLDLAGLAAAVCCEALRAGARVLRYAPVSWKGNRPKDLFQREILASLTEAEREHVPRSERTGKYRSDPLDAVGLGLFVLGRLGTWHSAPERFAEQVETAPSRRSPRSRRAPPEQPLPLFASASPRARRTPEANPQNAERPAVTRALRTASR